MLAVEDDQYCFVCGEKNPAGLHLSFSLHDGKVTTEFVPEKIHQGYKDIVHGGIISALLDETMVKAALMQKMPAVTAELHVRFKNPLKVGDKAIVEAAITKSNKRIIEVAGSIKKAGDILIAEGYATLLRTG